MWPLYGQIRLLIACAVIFCLSACELPDWMGKNQKPPLPGERISILQLDKTLEPDSAIADLDVRLPRPFRNKDWPQAAGFANHAMHHLEAGENLRQAWKTSIGIGSDQKHKHLSRPVVSAGKIITMDAASHVTAFRTHDGRLLWKRSLIPEGEEETVIGGGVSIDKGMVYASTGFGFVHALKLDNG